jgi:hypothetical protein
MITCVTAPSRSGTSLTMQMLQAAGMTLAWDVVPNKTAFNPYGHYEIDWKKGITTLEDCEGKAVKVMPFDLYRLTPEHEYRFITILRDVASINASQADTKRFKNGLAMSDADQTEYWHKFTLNYIASYKHVIVGFEELFNGVAQQYIGKFMGFNELQIAKMNDCVDPSLWHFKPENSK